jgi:hypothetical protein
MNMILSQREAAILTLMEVGTLMETHPSIQRNRQAFADGLARIDSIKSALIDLENGIVVPMMRPAPRKRGGQRRSSEAVLLAAAARVMHQVRLKEAKSEEYDTADGADVFVARTLSSRGYKCRRGAIKEPTIREWRQTKDPRIDEVARVLSSSLPQQGARKKYDAILRFLGLSLPRDIPKAKPISVQPTAG